MNPHVLCLIVNITNGLGLFQNQKINDDARRRIIVNRAAGCKQIGELF